MLEREALSVRDRFVLVLVHVSATARVPPSETAALDVVNAAPLTAVPPEGRTRLPPSILTFPAALRCSLRKREYLLLRRGFRYLQ